ncbi:PH domain-containing protein [Salinicoccus sp. HZC-1]|uniref:PH domain-containing protein n=1 Tax=Salinicoccus sp. HZC-1 TaxID=3385497 RepID=UPI00398B8D86
MSKDLPFEPLEEEKPKEEIAFEGDEKTLLEFTATTYISPATKYTLTNERLKVQEKGYVLSGRKTDIELYKVKDSEVQQSLTQKMMNTGYILIISADESDPTIKLSKVKNPHDVREHIRSAANASRKREGVGMKYNI